MKDRIKNLLSADFENTQIVSLSYENTGYFKNLTDLPPFYRVIFKTVCGPNSLICTEMWLPDNWNGIYIAYGNGDGIAPDYLVAERHFNGEIIFSRRLYPYCSEANPRKPFMDCCDEYYLEK